MKSAHSKLLHPNFKKMTTQDRLLRAVQMAYAKHHLNSEHIGWEELGDVLQCELCNTMGDDEFIAWGSAIQSEANQPDICDD